MNYGCIVAKEETSEVLERPRFLKTFLRRGSNVMTSFLLCRCCITWKNPARS